MLRALNQLELAGGRGRTHEEGGEMKRTMLGQFNSFNWLKVGSEEPMPQAEKNQRPWRRQKVTLAQCVFGLYFQVSF